MKQVQKNIFFLFTTLLLSALVWPHAAFSSDDALDQGISWLNTNQDTVTGAWGSDTVRETATVVDVLKELGATDDAYTRGVQFLETTAPICTDHLSRKIIALSGSGSQDLEKIQNPDGGFGFAAGWPSSVPDSLLAAQALDKTGITSQQVIGRLLYYLTQNQNTDGSFGFVRGEGNLYLTAYAVKVLNVFKPSYAGLEAYINDAVGYLYTFKQSNGSFISSESSPVFTTALVARALISAADNASVILEAHQYLLGEQNIENGSWEEDPVVTALQLSEYKFWLESIQE